MQKKHKTVNAMRKMKDSGILWIGEIPEDWKLLKLKDSVDFEKGKNAAIFTQEYIGKNIGEYPVYSGQTQNDGVMGFVDTYDYDEDLCLFVTTVGAKAMSIKKLKGKFSLSQNCLIMKRKNDSNIDFLLYSLNALFDFERKMIPAYMQPSLRIEDLKKYVVYVPEKIQQQKIADFLDKKCAEIDKLIELQENMIEKLKEYKQSVITQAVTKGLDPDVPMKNSGIEWIGKIPEGWTVVRIKNLPNYSCPNAFIDGDWIESTDISDEGIRYITTGNIGDGIFKRQGDGYISDETFQRLNCKYAYPGDIVFSRLNAPYGRSCILPNDEDKYVVAVDIVILRTSYNKKYICYYTQCQHYQHDVEDFSRGTAMKRISRNNLGLVKILLPPLEEQRQIADYLDKKCAEIDDLIELKEQKIEKLKEYKKSLIYEYVTGKKEVC